MAEPTQKSESIESFLTDTFGFDRRESIRENRCVPAPIGCGQPVNEDDFEDEASKREYQISGLCAKCQKEVFG